MAAETFHIRMNRYEVKQKQRNFSKRFRPFECHIIRIYTVTLRINKFYQFFSINVQFLLYINICTIKLLFLIMVVKDLKKVKDVKNKINYKS